MRLDLRNCSIGFAVRVGWKKGEMWSKSSAPLHLG
jgi:hypothetical protein